MKHGCAKTQKKYRRKKKKRNPFFVLYLLTKGLPMTRVFRQGAFSCELKIKRCAAKNKGRNAHRCSRVTYRLPFCLQHSRLYMGVDVRPSTIVGAGCGLFAHRPLQSGDVVGPYTGKEFANVAQLQAARNGVIPMYTYQGVGGWVVDGACERGLMGYANEARGSGRQNCMTVQQFTLSFGPPQNHQNLFGPVDPNTGMCAVFNRTQCGRRNPFWDKGWRRIPHGFLRPPFIGRRFIWLQMTQNVAAGAELFLSYRSGGLHHQVAHSTTPRPC